MIHTLTQYHHPGGPDLTGIGKMLSRLGTASGASFSAAVTPGRNNPGVEGRAVEDGFAFLVRLTPNGDDGACHLQMEFDPIPIEDLREAFHALHAALVV